MARDFSPITFFQRTPNALLGRYFQEKHGVLAEIAFDELEENGQTAEAIFQAFSTLPEPQQAQIEAECQNIESMAHQAGVTALIDEATDFHKNAGFPEAINQQDSFHGKVMWTFLEHPNYWAGATSNLYAENIPDASWNRRNDLPHLPPHVEPEDTDRLADALSHYFRKKEGRGRHCRVDVYRKGNKENFFAHLSDFGQADPEWEGNNLNPRARLPSFEIIFVYTQSEGSLDIHAPGNTKYLEDLQHVFAESILKLGELDEYTKDNQVYRLDRLGNREFEFKKPENSGIQSAVIKRLRLSLIGGGKRKVSVEADPKNNPKAVYDLIDKLNPPPFHVTQAEIKVTFLAPLPGTRSKTRTFRISYPAWCNLRHVGRDEIIRNMLTASGIELVEPEPTEEDSNP
jgi:hypothetical protein